jgi:hypothetical protein
LGSSNLLIGAPLMTLTTARFDRRTLLIALMGIFTLGNALSRSPRLPAARRRSWRRSAR